MTKIIISYFALFFLIFVAALIHLSIGYVDINSSHILGFEDKSQSWEVLTTFRIPRVILAFTVGSSLALAGTLLQGIFRNPLASPGLIGTSAGGMLGAILLMTLGISSYYLISLGAFVAATLITAFVYIISYQFHAKKTNLTIMILAGVAVSAVCASISNFLLILNIDEFELGKHILNWSFGGLDNALWAPLKLFIPISLIGLAISFSFVKSLNLLTLNEENAIALGLSVEQNRILIILVSGCITGAAVACGGMIGFIGLICPHLVRLFTGNKHQLLIPFSFLCGGLLLLICDIVVKIMATNYNIDLRIGILTSMLGFPFFIMLILKENKS